MVFHADEDKFLPLPRIHRFSHAYIITSVNSMPTLQQQIPFMYVFLDGVDISAVAVRVAA